MEQPLQAADLVRVIAENIRARRSELGMTQQELAAASGLSQGYIAFLEQAKRSPAIEALAPIAEALNTSPHALLSPGIFSPVA